MQGKEQQLWKDEEGKVIHVRVYDISPAPHEGLRVTLEILEGYGEGTLISEILYPLS